MSTSNQLMEEETAGLDTAARTEQESTDNGTDMPQNDEQEPSSQPLSKKAQKRAAKAALFAERKLERRAREKAAKKEKKRELAQKRAAGELDEEEDDAQKRKKRVKGEQNTEPFGARVVVDLGFDEMMTDKEIVSLTSQLAYTYSANRKATRPFASIIFTSLNGRTRARLDSQSEAGYRRWARTEWWEESYEQLWTGRVANAAQSGDSEQTENTVATCPRENIVYLTADSTDELTELREDEVYIIGGICDHNRYKNLCLEKAEKSGVRAARLPIGKYLTEMTTRKVLTVNQVFEILAKWVETRDWEEALYSVVPKRKFEGKDGAKGTAKEEAVVVEAEVRREEEVARSDNDDADAQ